VDISRPERVELEVDGRLVDGRRQLLSIPRDSLNAEVVYAHLRWAYSRGYLDGLDERQSARARRDLDLVVTVAQKLYATLLSRASLAGIRGR